MILSRLIKKGGLLGIATATSATIATPVNDGVASVAKVAVAQASIVSEQVLYPPSAMTTDEEQEILTWLKHIDEHDLEIIEYTIDACRKHPDTRRYVLEQAALMHPPPAHNDDRRYCRECVNLTPKGLCLAAYRGELDACRDYKPTDDVPRRCASFKPAS